MSVECCGILLFIFRAITTIINAYTFGSLVTGLGHRSQISFLRFGMVK